MLNTGLKHLRTKKEEDIDIMIKKCKKCNCVIEKNRSCAGYDKEICANCFYEENLPFEIYPIGFVENDMERDSSDFGRKGSYGNSKINLLSSQKPFMYKLEDEEYLTIIYYLHKSRVVRPRFKRGLDGKEVGVFASRTPDRLSRIAIQKVNVINISDTTITVGGLDAIDGSPVLDIKMSWKK
ncbi:MAG: TrmO family methyltransferase [Verrucomicrobiota bacterium]|nr:TrmO family methyltransferase [Verrucomicrobiota bacterium]